MDKFDRPAVKTVSAEAEAALKAVAEKFGLKLERRNGRFSAERLTVKFEFVATAEGDSDVPADFARNARRLGLPEDCFGKTFRVGRTTYTVGGLVLRRPKYPVSGTGPKGGKYKFTVEQVKAGLAA